MGYQAKRAVEAQIRKQNQMTNWLKTILLLLVAMLFATGRSEHLHGDMLVVAGEPAPRFGRVRKATDDNTILFEALWDDKTEQLRIARDDVELLVITIDEERLEKLNPGDLHAYRDYAEELAAQQKDPLARDLAIRLYLIAAANGFRDDADPVVALSALAGLTALGRTENERKSFEVLRFVYDRRDHLVPLQPAANNDRVERSPNASETINDLLAAVRLLRQEDFSTPKERFQQNAIQKELANWSSICSPLEINEILSNKRLSLFQLNKMLKLELALQKGELPIPDRQFTNWAEQATQTGEGWTQLPDFSTVTEFDPCKAIYRNGEWIAPRE